VRSATRLDPVEDPRTRQQRCPCCRAAQFRGQGVAFRVVRRNDLGFLHRPSGTMNALAHRAHHHRETMAQTLSPIRGPGLNTGAWARDRHWLGSAPSRLWPEGAT